MCIYILYLDLQSKYEILKTVLLGSHVFIHKGGSGNGKGKKKTTSGQRQVTTSLPPAPFSISKTDIEEAGKRANEVVVPSADSFRPGPIFSRISRLNSHELKEVNREMFGML